MLTKIPEESKVFFLLQFTRELIRNSVTNEFLELETIVRKEKKDTHQEISKKIKEREKPVSEKEDIIKPLLPRRRFKRLPIPVLRIPELRLPRSLQYLKPTPTKLEVDLGKLNPLIKDPLVRSVECRGTEEPVVVQGKMGLKKTKIILDKEEIDQVIKKFSEAAKIPLHEGVLKMAKGNLILSAIISEIVGSKFIIKKMAYSQNPIFRK